MAIKPKKKLLDNLWLIVEYEYKYFISNSKEYKRNVEIQLEPVIKDVLKKLKVVFYEWLTNHVENESIKVVRRDVLEIYKELDKNVDNYEFHKGIVAIHKALHSLHSTGIMLEYIDQKYNITPKDLDELSNPSNLKRWEKEVG